MVGLGLRESFSLGSSIAISKVLRVLDNKVLKVTLLSIDSANEPVRIFVGEAVEQRVIRAPS
ncbi:MULTISPECIES: hypothetical protein [Burkholderia]|uniref:hypothetical protein n=1 Tax=Burkholderia TaxID=32008 RepID=UPI000981088E|nr:MULTISPECIES: hypothetical protein [Burkholderia]AQQ41589.1 hypothetical protein A8E75_21365 [Burkholderia cenocepacia]MBG0878973.1 hypothetical protein [Burkholderia sp. 9775_39]MBG0886554.1 hypothetical protein [Burkholderia sp. 9773_38]ONV27760.1 hypothetical protein A8E74_03865 [Burkholderia cenocepacia]ONV35215.1 hypothetical protein A8E78_09230 [Burkholderia cenocepacia]